MTTTITERLAALEETIKFQRGVLQQISDLRTISNVKTLNSAGGMVGQLEEATRRLEAHARALPEADEYQGWTNRETWTVNLWLSNAYTLNAAARSIATGEGKPFQRANVLRDMVKDNFERTATGFANDLLLASLVRVDWVALVNAFADEEA